VIIGDRYPKTGVDVCVTVLEAEEDGWWGDENADETGRLSGWGMSSVLAGCISVSGTALVDAGIDCVDILTGGTAALVSAGEDDNGELVLDPNPAEHKTVLASCVVGYMSNRDEISLVWTRGALSGEECTSLVDKAVTAAIGSRGVVEKAIRDGAVRKLNEIKNV
jgi:exosome complex component MTR3